MCRMIYYRIESVESGAVDIFFVGGYSVYMSL